MLSSTFDLGLKVLIRLSDESVRASVGALSKEKKRKTGLSMPWARNQALLLLLLLLLLSLLFLSCAQVRL